MARAFGRILASIWDDEDFLNLDPTQQRLYMFLLSQPNLNHAGLLPLTFKRWSDTAKGLTPERLEDDLIVLERARFIVLDFRREELLVRSLVRRDDVWKAPRVMGAMVSNAMEIRSRKLRAVLLAEIDRLPLDELNTDPGKGGGPSIRSQVDAHIAQLRKAYGPLPPPTQPAQEHPAEGVPEPLGEPPQEPLSEGGAQGHPLGSTHVGASPQARALPLPLPLPLPVAPAHSPDPNFSSPPASPPDDAPPAPAAKPKTPRKPAKAKRDTTGERPDVEALCERLVELMVANECKPPTITQTWRDEARRMLDIDGRDHAKAVALLEWALRNKFWRKNIHSIPTFREKYDRLRQEANDEWERKAGGTVLPFQRGPANDLGSDAHMERFLERQASRRQAAETAPPQTARDPLPWEVAQ